MPRLCEACVKADALKKLISSKGEIRKKCKICESVKTKTIDCENNRLKQLFKALIRYHFSEWEYNTHWGGLISRTTVLEG